jgi:uncharacterized protein YigE (DUF2233 family)
MIRLLWAAVLTLLPGFAHAASLVPGECQTVQHEARDYAVCTVTVDQDLRLFHSGPDGLYGGFAAINQSLGAKGQKLGFAMNAGMYAPDRSPLGLYIENGVESQAIVTADGPGNFGMRPNGVFCAGPDGFSVTESRAFAAAPQPCRIATQSGPMLVIDGALHPRFLVDSDSVYIRNGVGVSADGRTAFFAISDSRVTFHQFARLFRDVLMTPNALYLDGSISRLYAPALGRHDRGLPLGPIIGTVVPRG